MSTKIAFQTPQGSVQVPAGTSLQLGTVDVSPYDQIRVVAFERVGSGSTADIRLTLSEGPILEAQLDVLQLKPQTQVTKVYDVPGTQLTIFADAHTGSGTGNVDVIVYGN